MCKSRCPILSCGPFYVGWKWGHHVLGGYCHPVVGVASLSHVARPFLDYSDPVSAAEAEVEDGLSLAAVSEMGEGPSVIWQDQLMFCGLVDQGCVVYFRVLN